MNDRLALPYSLEFEFSTFPFKDFAISCAPYQIAITGMLPKIILRLI